MQRNTQRALKAGAAGALALNAIHESARQFVPDAPRIHEVAMRATQRFLLDPVGLKPSPRQLYLTTLAGDLLSNSLYYAVAVGAFRARGSKAVWGRAVLFGLAAGAMTMTLPPVFKLKQQRSRNLAMTSALTTAWYLLGALASAAVYRRSRQL